MRIDFKTGTFYNGDCFDVMATLDPGTVDMVLCDLPYGTTQNKWDAIIPFAPLWAHYWNLLKANGPAVLTANQPFTSAMVMSQPQFYKYDWVWEKNNPSGHLNANKMPLRCHEDILVFSRGAHNYNPQKMIYLWDYKFGHGYVDVFENWQLVDYAAGIFRHFAINPDTMDQWHVRFVIAQPRWYGAEGKLRKWTCAGTRLADLLDDLHVAAMAATDTNAPFNTGDHCLYCEGAHACPALLKAGGRSVDVSERGTPHDLSPMAVGLELTTIKAAIARLEALSTGLKAQGEAYIRSGKAVTGWEFKSSSSRVDWTAPVEEVLLLGDMMGLDLRKPAEPVTPTQAIKKGFDASVISEYSTRMDGKKTLQPIDKNGAAKAFK